MSAISPDEVRHLATVAEINVTDAEVSELTDQLAAAITAISQVREVAEKGGDVPQMSHPGSQINNLRPDQVAPSLSTQEALAGAPAVEDERFAVPQIMGEEP